MPVISLKQWFNDAVKRLGEAGISTARLDAEVLLADALHKDRSWLRSNDDVELSSSSIRELNKKVNRRAKHEPLAYIRGKQEFYGREFYVSPETLTPRPETETLVELALDVLKKENTKTVADIGTGSGCIIITLELESNTEASFIGYEISNSAIKIAKKNAKNLQSTATFRAVDITSDVPQEWQGAELVVANLPYVPADFKINLAASHEPAFAIFGGQDGLDYYRVMFEKLGETVQFVLTESMPPQHKELEKIAKGAGYKLQKIQDFIQVFRKVQM